MFWMINGLVGIILFGLIVNLMKYPYGGSDHSYHFKLINLIKRNNYRFVVNFDDIYSYMEVCPQLYHWICSAINPNFLLKKANYVNYIIGFVLIISFNIFLWLYQMCQHDYFGNIEILLLNILFITIPISYVIWNAKFMGLSARIFGLFLSYIYIFILFFYINESSLELFCYLSLIVFFMLLGSQFAYQFFLFSNPFIAICLNKYEILLLIPISILILFIFNYKYALNFLKSQYNHKRNYSKFMIKDCHFKARYSIWRDFVYDFWLKKDKAYFLGNPVIEVFIGALPNCFVLCYFPFSNAINNDSLWLLYILASSSFFAFWITSLRIGRFLGEPQRYIEFGIPFFTILSIVVFPIWLNVIFIIFNVVILLWYAKNSQYHRQLPEHIKIREELIEYMKNNFTDEYKHLLSNDNEIARHFYISDYEPHVPNHCGFYNDKDSFLANYYKGDYHRISPTFLVQEMELYSKGTLILYTNLLKFYDEKELEPLMVNIKLELINTIGKFKIFKFSKG